MKLRTKAHGLTTLSESFSESSKSYKVTLDKITKYRKRIFTNKDIFFDDEFEYEIPLADALALSRDDDGFFVTDFRTAQTSCAGAYAIGEVARRMHPCIATALADGVVAAKAIQARMGR